MVIFFEFIPHLFVALAFDFVLYLTGAGVLRVVSFGLLKCKLHSFSEYKAHKNRANNGFLLAYFVGILFYASIIALFVWFN